VKQVKFLSPSRPFKVAQAAAEAAKRSAVAATPLCPISNRISNLSLKLKPSACLTKSDDQPPRRTKHVLSVLPR